MIELTPDEIDFILSHILQLTVPLNRDDAAKLAMIGRSCIVKLEEAKNGTGE